MGNQNPKIEEENNTMAKRLSTKQAHKTKDLQIFLL
jgi:hypothetical protein